MPAARETLEPLHSSTAGGHRGRLPDRINTPVVTGRNGADRVKRCDRPVKSLAGALLAPPAVVVKGCEGFPPALALEYTLSRTAFLDAVGASVFVVSSGPTKYGTVTLPDRRTTPLPPVGRWNAPA
jgi:hypothetical protein